jgi:hypothetical protein
MHTITTILVVMSLIFSCYNPFLPLDVALNKATNTNQVDKEPEVETPQVDEITEGSKYKISSFTEYDFEGYCTLQVPASHLTLDNSVSTNTYKRFVYKDSKTKLEASFVTDMGADTDIPGYISKEQAGVDTVTNDKSEETHGDNVTWVKIKADSRVDGMNVYIYYTLEHNQDKDSNSAFWIKALVAPDSDGEEFYEALSKTLDTYSYYAYWSSQVFETPDTGYYATIDTTDNTKADTSDYKKNDRANTVFADRGGYVEDADISENWESLEIIIDNVKFTLPCTMDDFYKAGYQLNSSNLRDIDLQILYNNKATYKLINDNGTVVTVTLRNGSGTETKYIDDCSIVGILVDRNEFVNIPKDDNEDDTETETETETEEETKTLTEDEIENATLTDEEYALKYGIYRDDERDMMDEDEIEDHLRDLDDFEPEYVVNNNATGEISNDYEKDVHYKSHIVILPGGVTWDVYTDDLLEYYGTPSQKIPWDKGESVRFVWEKDTKYMRVTIGAISTIQSVELSCESLDN